MIHNVIKVVDLVSKFDETPSLKIYNSILDVLVKEDIDLARKFYREKMMESGVEGDDYTFGILMKGLCLTNRIDEGFKHLAAMKSRGLIPNTVIYNALLHALCKNGKGNVVQALVMLEKSFGNGCVPDVVTVTKVIGILCNEGRVTEAVEILERVKSNGGSVDVEAYNTVIKGFSMDMFQEMKMAGIIWNFVMFDTLVNAIERSSRILRLRKESSVDDVKRVYDQMTEEGGIPSALVYSSLIHGFCQKGLIKEAFELMNEMISRTYFPIATTFNSVLIGLCKEGKIGSAVNLLEDLVGRGCLPDVESYNPLVEALCRKGEFQKAWLLLLQMVDKGVVPDFCTWNSLVLCLSQEKMWIEDKSMFREHNLLE
ncbi:hypothetical protein RHSIM_Rhsim10G0193900 [Rhododendron simsii]|uniref:PROP1-like PPR domain-containing protein n=1 Tax=Rhododendron simsii TaxID=118357 RepID=A0A834LDP9_RHOSS|nr:hypothetical protein RHSIM_Rhsim10G0193900 [Rhododendron simsii]